MITGSEIAAIYGDSTLSGMFTVDFIYSVLKEKIESVIGDTALAYINDNGGEHGDPEVQPQKLKIQSALAYYCAAQGLHLVATRAENRGVFELNAELARSASPQAINANQMAYNTIGNGILKSVVEWLETGAIEGDGAVIGSERLNATYSEKTKRANLI